MLMVSGLSLGDPTSDPLATDLLVDLITGNLGGCATRVPAPLPLVSRAPAAVGAARSAEVVGVPALTTRAPDVLAHLPCL